ncbi:hypothetical protein LEN26_013372 [Aphanomyces euteiches]|nr:hypothetical protein LEN26_013372 [Aphanomyces euteiches]KAH9112294.1 hypothetical protein AeMF1_013371 [Aphanomyces euteiches]KAH9195539.1 hypothetical protein AeNC1_002499 [Aphanomyces euteiches]
MMAAPEAAQPEGIVDRFRPVEKLYRHRGDGHKNAKQRRLERQMNVQGVDYSDVIDVHNLENNTEANRARIRTMSLPRSKAFSGTILEPSRAQLFEIDGVSGLRVLINAMPRHRQVQWAMRAVHEYSKNPYTNISVLKKDRSATNHLWENAWRDRSPESWKAFHSLRWANVGRHYDWTARQYMSTEDMPPLPQELEQFVQEVFDLTDMTDCKQVEAGIVNFYPAGTTMGGHLDDAEEDMVNPIVSLSLGTQCIYLQGGFTRETKPTPIWLNSGDVVIMGGEARRCFHGVPLVTSNLPGEFTEAVEAFRSSDDNVYESQEINAFLEYISKARVNINLRRVQSST